MATEEQAAVRRRGVPWWPFLWLLCVGVAYTCVRVRSAAEVECDVGINAGMAAIGTYAAGLALLFVDVVAVTLLNLVPERLAVALLVPIVLIASALVFFALSGPPAGYPSPVESCGDNNIPDWWPFWLPSGAS